MCVPAIGAASQPVPGLVRAAAWIGLACACACGRDAGVASVDDAGFVFPDDTAGTSDTGTADDADESGCAVLDLAVCSPGRECCAIPDERCVPSAVGPNMCLPSGPVTAGAPCGGGGEDDCGFGLLCATSQASPERAVCRRICAIGTDACGAGACRVELEIGGESIGLCD